MYESSCTPVRHERRDLYRVKDPCTAYHMFIPKTEEGSHSFVSKMELGQGGQGKMWQTRRLGGRARGHGRKDRRGEIGYRRTYGLPLHLKCVVLIIHEGNGDWLKRCTGNGGKLNYRLQVPS